MAYPNFYTEVQHDKITDRETVKLGFSTTAKTKPLIIDQVTCSNARKRTPTKRQNNDTRNADLHRDRSGAMEAEASCFDDCVMSLALSKLRPRRGMGTSRYPEELYLEMVYDMATNYKRLTESEIVKMVEDNIKTSVGYYDSDLSRERKKVTEYYNATLPKPAHDGNSKYVSQDVYDAVQSMSAALLETFSVAIALSNSLHKDRKTCNWLKCARHIQTINCSAKMTVSLYSRA